MGNSEDGRAAIATWIQKKRAELSWTQKRLADEAGTSDTNISELVNERQDLTAEMADKFASVPELKTTREELLDIFGGKTDAHLNQRRKRKRDAALASFDRLPDPAQDLALDMLTMLEKRERDRTKGDK